MQGDVSAMDETKVFENETDAGQVDASNVQLSIRKNENLDINRESWSGCPQRDERSE